MEKAYEIVVKGDVQRSAFRRFVKLLAKKHNLFGSVENLDNYDDDVRIICEGEEGNAQEFIKRLENQSEEDKEETTATARCIPSGQKKTVSKCVKCGKNAEIKVLFAKAY